jgi:hypothetical protein
MLIMAEYPGPATFAGDAIACAIDQSPKFKTFCSYLTQVKCSIAPNGFKFAAAFRRSISNY